MKNIIETGIPKVKKYMSETGRALQVSEVAEYLGVVDATAFGLLDLMYAFGIVQKEKRGRAYYFLKGVYSDEQIIAMLPPKKSPRIPRTRVRPRRRRGWYDEMLDKFMESRDKLVEITVENRSTAYVKQKIKKKIKERGLTDQVEASRVDEWIYLEKIEQNE